jgi:hypothetical protein
MALPTHMNNVGRAERKEGFWFMFQKERERENLFLLSYAPSSNQLLT